MRRQSSLESFPQPGTCPHSFYNKLHFKAMDIPLIYLQNIMTYYKNILKKKVLASMIDSKIESYPKHYTGNQIDTIIESGIFDQMAKDYRQIGPIHMFLPDESISLWKGPHQS